MNDKSPVFIGPTAIHHSKTKAAYKKIASAVVANSLELTAKGRGFIMDGKQALHDALGESMKKATGLRCFNHFHQNCKKKLTDVGIRRKQDQNFFLNMVFGDDDAAVLNAKDRDELKACLDAARQLLDEEDTCLTGSPTAQFSRYLNNHRKMMNDKRRQGCLVMSLEIQGSTTQIKLSNKLTRQKEAVTKNDKKKTNMTKLEFVTDVWEQVDHQQQSELFLAIFGHSEEYELADFDIYLQVEPERWFDWTANYRDQYIKGFNKLTVENVIAKKKTEIKQDSLQDEPMQ